MKPILLSLVLAGLFVESLGATTFVVSNTNNSGAGSLRQAILDANATPGADVITFSAAGTVSLLSALPAITETVDIQGNTAPGYAVGAPTFGLNTASVISMMTVSGATGVVITGLDFSSTATRIGTAITLTSSINATVRDCKIQNRVAAIVVSSGSNPTIQGNDFTNSGQDANNPQVYLNGPTGIVAGAINNNTWGGNTTVNCLLRLTNISQALTVGDASVAGAHVVIADGSAATCNFNNAAGVYATNCTGVITMNNLDLTKGVTRTGIGIYLDGCAGPVVTNCALGNRLSSIYMLSGSNPRFVNNVFSESGLDQNNPQVYVNTVTSISTNAITGNTWGGTTTAVSCLLRLHNITQALTVSDGSVAGSHIVIPDASVANCNLNSGGVYASVCSGGITLDNLDFTKTGTRVGTAIFLDACTAPIVRNCALGYRSTAVYMIAGSNPTIQNNVFLEGGQDQNSPQVMLNGVAGIVPNAITGNTWGGTTTGVNCLARIHNISQALMISDGSVAGSHIVIPDGSVGGCNLSSGGLYISNCAGAVTVDNLDLARVGTVQGVGVYLDNCTRPTVINCALGRRATSVYMSSGSNPTIQNNVFTESGISQNNPQVMLNTVTGIVPNAVTGNTWGGTSAVNCLVRIHNITQALTVSDGSVAGSHIVIPDGSVPDCNLNSGGLYVSSCTGSITMDNLDFTKVGTRAGYGIFIDASTASVVRNSGLGNRNTSVYVTTSSNPIIQNNVFTESGASQNLPQVFFSGVTGLVADAVTNNTWGGGSAVNCLLRLHSSTQAVTISDGSVVGSHIVIPDGVATNCNLTGGGVYMSNSTGAITVDNVDFTKVGSRMGYGVYVDVCTAPTIRNSALGNRSMGLYMNTSSNPTIQNNDFWESGIDANNPQVYLTSVSAIAVNAVTGNTWGGSVNTINCLLRLNAISQAITLSDGSVAGSHIVIPDASAAGCALIDGGVYASSCGGAITLNNLDLSKAGTRTGRGVYFQTCISPTLINCNLANRSNSAYFGSCSNPIIRNNIFTNSGVDINSPQLYLSSVTGLVPGAVTGNTWGGNNDVGSLLRLNGHNQAALISDGSVPNSHIEIPDGSMTTAGLASAGIAISSCTGQITIDNVDFSRTSCTAFGTGLLLQSSTSPIVRNSTFVSRTSGLNVGASNSNPLVSCNSFASCTNAVSFSGTNTGNNFVDNTFFSNGTGINQTSGTLVSAANNYWGGTTPTAGGVNGYIGSVTVLPELPALTCAAVPVPEINVTGNSINIADNDFTATTADFTDFGSAPLNAPTVQAFVIQNIGGVNLTISNITTIGLNASEFTISGLTFPVTVPAGGSVTVNVRFIPTALGVRTATLNISNSDCSESLYDFALRGTGVDAPEINISGNTITIADGDNAPALANFTDFGSVSACATVGVAHPFAISNLGSADLIVSNITSNNTAFAVSGMSFPATITAGNTSNFTVTFMPSASGPTAATILVSSDDIDEASYDFKVQGTGSSPAVDITRGNALQFDGNNQFVAAAFSNFGTASFTAECWFKTSSTAEAGIIGKRDACGHGNFWEIKLDNGLVYFELDDNNINYTLINSANTYNDNSWHHVAGVRDGNDISLYIDGILVASATTAAPADVSNVADFAIAYSPCGYFEGAIDEVRLWNGARSATALRENMHLTLSGCEANLYSYFQMNEAAGATTADNVAGVVADLFNNPSRIAAGVNVGNDPSSSLSESQTLSVPLGSSSQNFNAAHLLVEYLAHSVVEDVTATYQAFSPNSNTGAAGVMLYQNPVWTINNSNSTSTQQVNLTFTFPNNTFTNIDGSKYRLYWRTMGSEGDWTLIDASAEAMTNSTITFNNIRVFGQFMVARFSDAVVSDLRGVMYDFDGGGTNATEYITLDNPTNFNIGTATSFTFEAWIKRTQAGRDFIFSHIDNNNGYQLFVENTNKLALEFKAAGSSFLVTSANNINLNQWYHVAAVLDRSTNTAQIYINGILEATSTDAFLANDFDVNAPAYIGVEPALNSALEFDGYIDEVRFWNVPRSRNQLRENMHITLLGNETGIVSYYQFNNDLAVGTAGGVVDAIGSNNGTTTNMAAASQAVSEVAVAGGVSQRITVNAAGLASFDVPGLDINFTSSPNGEIVVSRLQTQRPHGAENILGDVDNEYFVVWNYGANASPTVDRMLFHHVNYVATSTLSEIALYKRGSRDYGNTWGTPIATASAITPGADASVAFTGAPLVNGFSQFVVVSNSPSTDLPIQWLNFEAERRDPQTVALHWATASETNNRGFYIERMLDRETEFSTVGFVAGQGTTTETSQYQTTDNNPYAQISYYRLRQVDNDGYQSYSEVRAIAGTANANAIQLYPNPTKDYVYLQFAELSEAQQVATIRLLDMQGLALRTFKQDLAAYQSLRFDAAALPAGAYMLEVTLGDGTRQLLRFVKMHD